MAVSDTARKNHDELFPGHVSTLATSDPELIETFDKFAFDEILQHGNLDTRTRLMVQLAAMIASQARLLAVLTQLIPFIGYPRTLNGLRIDEVTPA
jgi:alkylhydroperoxidase/carboxymuconolactone decarboxylase family protein YurZ